MLYERLLPCGTQRPSTSSRRRRLTAAHRGGGGRRAGASTSPDDTARGARGAAGVGARRSVCRRLRGGARGALAAAGAQGWRRRARRDLLRHQLLRRLHADLSRVSVLPRSSSLRPRRHLPDRRAPRQRPPRARAPRGSASVMQQMAAAAAGAAAARAARLVRRAAAAHAPARPAAGHHRRRQCARVGDGPRRRRRRRRGPRPPTSAEAFLFFECMRRDAVAIEAAAGVAARLPIVRPSAGDGAGSVCNYAGACDALRQAVGVCTLLANQAAQLKNSYGLRLLADRTLHARAVPLPVAHPLRATGCLWASERAAMRAEVGLLSHLAALSRHFAASSLAPSRSSTRSGSSPPPRSPPSPTRSCACARRLATAFGMRAAPPRGRSTPGRRARAAAEGGGRLLCDPALALTRAALLTYFDCSAVAAADHTLFCFERSMGFGGAERALLEQVALQVGLPTDEKLLPRYLPTTSPRWPRSSRSCRCCATSSSSSRRCSAPRPMRCPSRAWRRVTRCSGGSTRPTRASPSTFGDAPLKCCAYVDPQERSFLSWPWFHGAERLRAPPSDADPTVVVRRLGCEKEHKRPSPARRGRAARRSLDFGGRLGAREYEQLLSYLTAVRAHPWSSSCSTTRRGCPPSRAPRCRASSAPPFSSRGSGGRSTSPRRRRGAHARPCDAGDALGLLVTPTAPPSCADARASARPRARVAPTPPTRAPAAAPLPPPPAVALADGRVRHADERAGPLAGVTLQAVLEMLDGARARRGLLRPGRHRRHAASSPRRPHRGVRPLPRAPRVGARRDGRARQARRRAAVGPRRAVRAAGDHATGVDGGGAPD